MKKFTYLASMLLVMAGAVSCEKKAEVKEPAPQPTGIMRQVTISAGQAAEKTSVSGGTLTWSKDDQLNIVPTTGSFEAAGLNIISGVGTASGTFQGSIDSGIADDTQLYGWAGGDWTYNSGTFTIDMPAEQTYVENGLAENAYPSIGTGTITGGIALSNPFGVLCLNVKGETTDEVNSITLTSAANNLAGEFTVNPSTTPALVTDGSLKAITLNCTTAVALATDGVKFYMVVPAASYADKDLTVTVTKSDNTSFDVILGATAVTANNVTTADVKPCGCKIDGTYKTTITGKSGRVYPITPIGKQCWIAENLKELQYEDDGDADSELKGKNLPASTMKFSERNVLPYYIDVTNTDNWHNDAKTRITEGTITAEQVAKLGYMYNWAAAVGLANETTINSIIKFEDGRQGICPKGWFVPSSDDWKQLINFVEVEDGKGANTAAKYLKSSTGWWNGSGSNVPSNDEYGFSWLAGGCEQGTADGYFGVNSVAQFNRMVVSDTYSSYGGVIPDCDLSFSQPTPSFATNYKYDGFFVRCVRSLDD